MPVRTKSSVWVISKNTTESFLPVISISAYKFVKIIASMNGDKRSLFNWTFAHMWHIQSWNTNIEQTNKNQIQSKAIFGASSKFSTAQN